MTPMPAIKTDAERFSLHLAAPTAVARLAAPVLASHLGISLSTALHRLTSSPAPIARRLHPMAAERLFVLLSTLGLDLRLSPDDDSAQQCDLSIQRSVWAHPHRTARRLAETLGRDVEEVDLCLSRPGGLILPGLPFGKARQMENRLSAIRGLIILRTDCDGGLFDLFAPRPLTPLQEKRVADAVSAIGARPDSLTGACAAGIDAAVRARLAAQLPDLGLIALDRSIQRFDLHLIGVTGWVSKDLADFLAARTAQPRARFEVISPSHPILLDHGLTHAVLRQFCADYAAVGLSTRPMLRGLRRFPENPSL